jgi:hypothetical protein
VRPSPVPIKAKFSLPGLVLVVLVSGQSILVGGIAHFAHGGALFGFLICGWKKNQFNDNRWD